MWDLIVSVPDRCLSFYFKTGTQHLLAVIPCFSCNSPLYSTYPQLGDITAGMTGYSFTYM